MTIPRSEDTIKGPLRAIGPKVHLSRSVAALVSDNMEKQLKEALRRLGIATDWNSLFWVVHPGGRVILDEIEMKLRLKPDKLGATRHVLSKFGNMSGSSIFFVLDEMRKRMAQEGKVTAADKEESEVLSLCSELDLRWTPLCFVA
ncbi:hypothetical protein ACJRO7_026178 [Eucalyptus globulus]|uniref:Chalcone/stilbene synthase C-terminal domain-containing protein n=1 Tax=Eucalyptus globulus TaxID=34317 RepID=A0ABD3KF09_EUCGL